MTARWVGQIAFFPRQVPADRGLEATELQPDASGVTVQPGLFEAAHQHADPLLVLTHHEIEDRR